MLHALEGWGKTSFAAHMPKPIFLQSRGETGLETLIDSGQLSETPHFPECQSWPEVLGAIQLLIDQEHEFRTLVVDTVNGAERLCHEHVCARDFNGDWTDGGFMGYHRGFEVSLADWRQLLSALDELRATKRMNVVLLCHTRVKPFRNPEGADFDRYSPDMNEKTWSLTHKWADVVLFGNFSTTVVGKRGKEETDPSKRGKGTGGQARVLYTVRTAAYDAKNRIGLPHEIEMGDSPAQAWASYLTAVKAAREVKHA